MFESIGSFFKKFMKQDQKELPQEASSNSKDAAKERLHVVLMQDRANVSADFLELMKQEIVDVIKKYIVVDEDQIDVRLTNQENEDGTIGAPVLYANIPVLNIRNDIKGEVLSESEKEEGKESEGDLNNEDASNDKATKQSDDKTITETEKEKIKEKGKDKEKSKVKDNDIVDKKEKINDDSNKNNEVKKEKVSPKKKSAKVGRPKGKTKSSKKK